jgi:hypothetical protein
LITYGQNCEKGQHLNIHSAFGIRKASATIAGYYKVTLSPKGRMRKNGSVDMYKGKVHLGRGHENPEGE